MQIIDLSHYLEPGMSLFPGDAPPLLQETGDHEYRKTQLTLGNHLGTHVDAPSHLIRDGASLDQLDISRFFGLSLLVDVGAYAGGRIPEQVFRPHEEILSHCQFVTLKTGWARRWGSPGYLTGYPLLCPEAARFLTRFPLSGVAMDCLSLDPVEGEQEIHRILLGAGFLSVENLTWLDKILGEVFLLSALPLKWRDSNGSPVRAMAFEAPAGIYYPG